MKIQSVIASLLVVITTLLSCDDNDSFTTSSNNLLTLSKEALSLDTVFSKVPSASKMFKVYNYSGDGIRIQSVRQEKGAAKSGFRVNVNGMFINPEENDAISTPIELRDGDSLRVWVEMTSPRENGKTEPQKVEESIVFNLESGRQQVVKLSAWTWDADTLQNHYIAEDTVIDNEGKRPLVVYGKLTVAPEATMTVKAGSIIYFHQDGELDVKGRLVVSGDKDNLVTMRCDRLDSLLQLSYDEIPGKWQGVTLSEESHDNAISYLDLHGADYGIKCLSAADGSAPTATKLSMDHSTVINVLGDALSAVASKVVIDNCLLANASGYCLNVTGGDVDVNSSTLASFYGYTASRKYALRMTDVNDNVNGNGNEGEAAQLPIKFRMRNTIVTGYADDQVYWYPYDSQADPDILIQHSYLRTVKPEDEYSKKLLQDNLYDADAADDYQGRGLFTYVNDDGTSFEYDFTPRDGAPVIGAADPATSSADDINGTARKSTPDMGCYESGNVNDNDNP
ncbi:MAG: hypothetical protein IJ782_03350 [Prevotella sp.]|nr:hypothetical protein [Prevotella sp.]